MTDQYYESITNEPSKGVCPCGDTQPTYHHFGSCIYCKCPNHTFSLLSTTTGKVEREGFSHEAEVGEDRLWDLLKKYRAHAYDGEVEQTYEAIQAYAEEVAVKRVREAVREAQIAETKYIFKALKGVWLKPPVDRAEDYKWSANDIVESLDLLEKEWSAQLQDSNRKDGK